MGDKYGIGSIDNPCPPDITLSNKWYVEHYGQDSAREYRCVMECEGHLPCNGRADSYKGKSIVFTFDVAN